MSNLLTFSYWFALSPSELMPSVKLAVLAAFAVLFALGLVVRRLSKKRTDSMFWAVGAKKFSSLALWMGATGLLLVFFTHELVYFFGARFWYLVWLAIFLVWLVHVVKFVLMEIPKKKAAFNEKARIEKYLPKKN